MCHKKSDQSKHGTKYNRSAEPYTATQAGNHETTQHRESYNYRYLWCKQGTTWTEENLIDRMSERGNEMGGGGEREGRLQLHCMYIITYG